MMVRPIGIAANIGVDAQTVIAINGWCGQIDVSWPVDALSDFKLSGNR